MKKLSLIAASVAFVLTGCGGSDSNDSAPEVPQTFTVKAMSGSEVLVGAQVYADANCTSGKEIKNAVTDSDGSVQIAIEHQSNAICIKKPSAARSTVLELKAPAHKDSAELFGTSVDQTQFVTPMTTLVVEKVTDSVDLTAAVDEIKETFESLGADEKQLFGDVSSNKKVAVAADTIVENNNKLTDEQLVDLSGLIGNKTDEQLNNFAPVLDGESFVENHRPHQANEHSQKLNQVIKLDNANRIKNIYLGEVFTDTDNDKLSFSITKTAQELADFGLQFDNETGVISSQSDMTKAGTLKFSAYANDSKVSSRAVAIEIVVEAKNQMPTVVGKAQIQAELDKLNLVEGTTENRTVSLNGLFSDADGDELTLAVGTQPADSGLTLSIDGDILTIKGTAKEGSFKFTVTAKDEHHTDAAEVEFTLKVADNGELPEEDKHALEGKIWYMLERGRDNGTDEQDYSSVWCDTYKFVDDKVYMNQRAPQNLTQCSDETTEVGSYDIANGIITASFPDGNEAVEMQFAISSDVVGNQLSQGALQVIRTEDGMQERNMFFTSKADIERRITMTSEQGPANRDHKQFLLNAETSSPDKMNFELGTVSIQMVNNKRFDLFVEADGQEFGETSVTDFYQTLAIAGDGVDESQPINLMTRGEYGIGFDLMDSFVEGKVYSIMLLPKEEDNGEALVEPLYFNMKWIGQGNND
ncbi:Ig-like domain-containing protein [Ferrimonas senticii]|uniref:Ig-like domain-containing protein n=1 Tax=Ferrimonas senticii TaxID=394566 RepID=UPI0003F4F262|nr:Ig-like domain-containing protein [Ferrimonas senticii]